MRRVWYDREGNLWVETDIPGEVVRVDRQVIGRVADKFGTYAREDVSSAYGPLWELKEPDRREAPPTLREWLRASRLNAWWLHPSLWERPGKLRRKK